MIGFPSSVEAARAAAGTYRAGGTDLQDRRQLGVARGDVIDLRDVPGLDGIEVSAEGARVGARCTLDAVALHPELRAGWPGLAEAFGGLATPQIRRRATVGGSLLQHVRCPYYRSDEPECLKKGGLACSARRGVAPFHSVLDLGPCIAPHPSTPMLALLAFDALLAVDDAERPIPEVLGDGRDPLATHTLSAGAFVRGFRLPPAPVERSVYARTTHRARAEWPLVEVIVRVRTAEDGTIASLVLAAGGIANRPLRFDAVAEQCVGLRPDDPRVAERIGDVTSGAGAIPQTAWRRPTIPATLLDALRRATS